MGEPAIVFEDNALLVLDKPAGWVVTRTRTTKGKTIQDWVKDYLEIKGQGIGGRVGIVHRLDKETSGLLLVAKSVQAFEKLQLQFKKREVKKRYLALVHGKVEPGSGMVRAPIARNPMNRQKFGVFLEGKEAETRYKVISDRSDEKEKFSLLELYPKTGRTHQIRVHLKYIGHPVVGDEKYAGRKTAKADRRWCPRQFLHASHLWLSHPETAKKVGFTAPLPGQLKAVLFGLRSLGINTGEKNEKN